MTEQDLQYQAVPLPEDVLKLKFYGDFAGTAQLIGHLLTGNIPHALRKRLELELGLLDTLAHGEYPYDEAAAEALLRDTVRDFAPGELERLRADGAVDWRYIDGRPRYFRRFYQNLLKTSDEYRRRQRASPAESNETLLLRDNIAFMRQEGGRTADIRLRATLRVKKEFQRAGERLRVYLPIPNNARQQTKVRIIHTDPEAVFIAPPEAPQRTVCFEGALKPNQVFSVEYSYTNHVDFRTLNDDQATNSAPGNGGYDAFLAEQLWRSE
jgi:hypothetical protein